MKKVHCLKNEGTGYLLLKLFSGHLSKQILQLKIHEKKDQKKNLPKIHQKKVIQVRFISKIGENIFTTDLESRILFLHSNLHPDL